MIPEIRYLAVYQVSPVSAITHVAPVARIEPWKETGKLALYFMEKAKPIGPLRMVPGGRVSPPQSIRYTSYDRLQKARNLDDVF